MTGELLGQGGDDHGISVGFHANIKCWQLCQMSSPALRLMAFVGKSANMDKERLLGIIKAQLKKKGLTASEASERAVGNPYLISNMGRDRYGMPSTENLLALCGVLDLEFYVGPPRDSCATPPPVPAGDKFAEIPLHEAWLAAGSGAANGSEEIVEHLAFRRDWLRRIGVSPANARLVRVIGDSMEPTIQAGDMVLIDSSKTAPPARMRAPNDRRPPPVYALLDDGQARVKRIEMAGPQDVLLISDNKLHPTEKKSLRDITLIGRVAWWGHTVRD